MNINQFRFLSDSNNFKYRTIIIFKHMDKVSKESFENTIELLINASPKSNVKGKPVVKWINDHFGVNARVTLVTGAAVVNRIREQFGYHDPVVVFVCKDDVNLSSIVSSINDNVYEELEVLLLMSASKPFNPNRSLGFLSAVWQ